ncbi:MAG TPA: MBL fold metallo-hydrolase [Spirochaetota bacterium]|nr:MBL fold metallo-hydrolase [Spirochaetota bacterium]HPJ34364.1 MBL fold metallo-hydrolase [Spirochaetota bacterium]
MRVGDVKIYNLTGKSRVYTSNVYLITGSWNTLEDVNALVDVGRDLSILEMILELPTGVGKKQVETVVITHNHYDHTSMLSNVKKVFNPKVYAYSERIEGVHRTLKDGEMVKLGDRNFEVIYSPGHSSDSVCFFNRDDGVLFSGDTPLSVRDDKTLYETGFVKALERLCRKDVRIIYPGHGEPMVERCNDMLRGSLKNLKGG